MKKRRPPTVADRLEIVVKADTAGTLAAVTTALGPLAKVSVIHAGIGPVNKNDLLLAATAGRLVVGFGVDALPYVGDLSREQGVEVRLYRLIHRLVADLGGIAARLAANSVTTTTVTGRGTVIALFKSSRKGIIIGCQVEEGRISRGDPFRLIGPAGEVYRGTVQSLQIQRRDVASAPAGSQAGIKIPDYNKVKTGYLVETFQQRTTPVEPWRPRPGVQTVA